MSKAAKKAPDDEIQMPSIYDDEFSVEESLIEEIDLTSAEEEEESEGFDPYDTARLYKK